jgi:hypothetical protein
VYKLRLNGSLGWPLYVSSCKNLAIVGSYILALR